MPELTFPTSSSPGRNIVENGGRLINCFAEKASEGAANPFRIRRDAGLTNAFSPTVAGIPRGALNVRGVLYVVIGNSVYMIAGTYIVTQLTGTVAGTGPVFMAADMATTPDILMVTSAGMYSISGTAVTPFSDPDFPAVNSITYVGGYFFTSSAIGKVNSSGINATTFAFNDFASADAYPDGLKRVIGFSRDLYMFGDASIEIWSNTANPTGFPFSFQSALPIGLIASNAVAGFELGFPGTLIWVGNDNKVYQLSGNIPSPVSEPYLEWLISKLMDKEMLEAAVQVVNGKPRFVLSSSDWTWVYDLSTGKWHERKSYGMSRWRAGFGVNYSGQWLVFDKITGQAFSMDGDNQREVDQPLVMEVTSSQLHRFPNQFIVDRADFYFAMGLANQTGVAPIETDPVVSISWSDDGGVTFKNPVRRSLGTQGRYHDKVTVRRCGQTKSQGRQWKLQIADPVPAVLLGGAFESENRAA